MSDKKLQPVVLKPEVVVNGVLWKLFSVEFDTADGKFSTYIYALDFGHAGLILEELKSTATITGMVAGSIDTKGNRDED